MVFKLKERVKLTANLVCGIPPSFPHLTCNLVSFSIQVGGEGQFPPPPLSVKCSRVRSWLTSFFFQKSFSWRKQLRRRSNGNLSGEVPRKESEKTCQNPMKGGVGFYWKKKGHFPPPVTVFLFFRQKFFFRIF